MAKVETNGKILKWARESYNLSLELVAQKMNKTVEIIESWENDEDFPTYAQLEKLAYEIYNKPLAIFFFDELPTNIKNMKQNFRTLNNEIYENIPSSVLKIINLARVMQLNLQELGVVSEYITTSRKFSSVDYEINKIREIIRNKY